MTLVVIVILAVIVACLTGHGATAVGTITVAALTVAVEELLRAALKYWLRVV